MATYRVSLERHGEMIPIGTIQGNRDSDMAFRYREEYLNDTTAIPISQSLPLRKEDFFLLKALLYRLRFCPYQ